MKYYIKQLVFLLALTASVAAHADDRVLKVWQADGQVLTISLADEPRTTYSDGNLIITSAKSTVTLPLEKVRRYTYESAANGVDETKAVRAAFSKDGESLTLTGLKPGTAIYLMLQASCCAPSTAAPSLRSSSPSLSSPPASTL